MSLRAMNAVWMHSEASGNDLLTLLAISDNANDVGFAFPSYPHLAAKTRLSRSTMMRCVSRLLDTDELSLVSKGTNGNANTYAVNVKALLDKPYALDKGSSKMTPTPGSSDSSNSGDSQPSASQPTDVVVANATATTSEDADDETLFPLPPPSPSAANDRDAQDLVAVWTHYVDTFEPTRPELTPSRERMIQKVLKETAAMDDRRTYLCKAISGLKVWRSKKPGDTSLSAIFQTRPNGSALADQLQFFVDQAESGGTSASPKVPSVMAGTISARKREVLDMLAYPDSPDHKERGLAAVEWLKKEARTEPIISVSGQLQGWQAVAA